MKNNYQNINEETLVQECLSGNSFAQKELYNRYVQAMFHTILRMIDRKSDAMDLLQESFIKVFKELKNFKGRSSLGAWIKRICINTTLSELKKNSRLEFVDIINIELNDESEEASYELEVSLIHEAVKNLPKGARIVLNLYLFEGFRHSEIADILNIKESTSKSQYIRGKNLLRKELKSMIYEQ